MRYEGAVPVTKLSIEDSEIPGEIPSPPARALRKPQHATNRCICARHSLGSGLTTQRLPVAHTLVSAPLMPVVARVEHPFAVVSC